MRAGRAAALNVRALPQYTCRGLHIWRDVNTRAGASTRLFASAGRFELRSNLMCNSPGCNMLTGGLRWLQGSWREGGERMPHDPFGEGFVENAPDSIVAQDMCDHDYR